MGRKQLVVCAALLATLGTMLGVPAASAGTAEPVYVGRHFGDPAVVRAGGSYVAVGTGPLTLRLKGGSLRKWKELPPALKRLPAWARNGDIWAADLAKVGKRWVLYYSAPVKGLTESGRCIGVARAKKPTAAFKPIDAAPLVCPAKGKTPVAGNQAPGEGLPRHGVIDPSLFIGKDGKPVLFYKTDGLPSTIRMLPLKRSGLKPRKGAVSTEVLRSAGVIENPVVVQRGKDWYLFTSEGSYTRCSYATVWRRASSPAMWSSVEPQVLLDRRTTGLCGPAGADVFDDRGRTMIVFHAWACRKGRKPCGAKFTMDQAAKKKAVRAMHVGRLRFTGGVPRISKYLRPRG